MERTENIWEEELCYEKRCLRTREGKLLFGPCGERLAVDILEPVPGFLGCIDFIHKMNVTELFTLTCDRKIPVDEMEVMWYPTYMTMSYAAEDVSFVEKKTIIAQDVAISLTRWSNPSRRPLTISLSSCPVGFTEEACGMSADGEADGSEGSWVILKASDVLRFGIRLGIAVSWNQPSEKITLAPGEEITLWAAAAVGNLSETQEENRTETMEMLVGRVHSCLAKARQKGESYWEELLAENGKFYEEAPHFISNDRNMNACFKYRWYILKNSMCRPGMGNFKETVMYEGRDHRMKKTPLSPGGWEFSKLIPLSTPLQITDLRWHPYHDLTKEIIRSAFAAQNEDGLLLTAYVEGEQASYANYMIYAVWLHYLVDGDKVFLESLLPKMERYIAGHEKVYGNPADSLLIETKPSLTGKEYQPSYWYFNGYIREGAYPANPKDKSYIMPLKRVDRSVYHYLNLMGLANIMRVLNREKQELYREKAQKLQQDILEKMWDADTGFFYDLHYETDEKAMVRNIVGIYPFWAQIVQEEQKKGILPLMDEEAFHTGSGFASVSKDCPVFSPDGGWKGNFFKGRNGCVWCGPSWPYTTGIALEALALESRRQNSRYDREFDELLTEYTRQHFRDGDRHRPYLVEHYNPITGERLSDEADYNHSFWLDIVIRFVAGVTVEETEVKIQPLHTHLKWWELTSLFIRGHRLDISCREAEDGRKVLRAVLDGKTAYTAQNGEVLCIKL